MDTVAAGQPDVTPVQARSGAWTRTTACGLNSSMRAREAGALQEEQAKKRLRDLIEERLASGPGRRHTKADEKALQAIARGEID